MFFELPPANVLHGQQDTYRVVRTLKTGSQGVTYLARRVRDGQRVTIKTPAVEIDGGLTSQEVREKLAEITGAFEDDFAALRLLHDVPQVAHVLDYGATRVEIRHQWHFLVFLVYRNVRGLQLDEHLAEVYGNGAEFHGVPTAKAFFDLAQDLATCVREVHRRLVIHGDIWPANLLVENERLVLVDFGQATLRDHPLAAGDPDRVPSYPYVAPERGKTIGADIYSIGGVLFYIATGAPPPAPRSVAAGLPDRMLHVHDRRQEIVGLIRRANPVLHAANFGIAEVVAHCLLASPLDRPLAVEDLLNALEMFSPERRAPGAAVQAIHVDVGSPVLRMLLELEVRRVQKIAEDMRYGMYDLIGDHNDIVAALTAYLAEVGSDGREDTLFLTVTTKSFWLQDTVRRGMFMAMNMEMARCGPVRRLFLVTEEDLEDADFRGVLRKHAEAMARFPIGGDADRDSNATALTTDIDLPGYWAGYIVMTCDEIAEVVADLHVGLLRRNGTWTTLVPVYGHDGTMVGLQFRAGDRARADAAQLLEGYRLLSKTAVPLDELALKGENDDE